MNLLLCTIFGIIFLNRKYDLSRFYDVESKSVVVAALLLIAFTLNMMPLVSAADSDGDGVDDADDECADTEDQDGWSIAENGCSYPTYLDNIWMCVEEGIAVTDLATEWKTADDEHTCSVSLSYGSTYMTITTPGIANHDMQGGPGGGINDQDYEWVLPLVPEDDSDCNPSESTNGCEMAPELGPVAVAVNGVPFYGPEDGPGGDAVATHIGQYTETEQEIWLGVCGAHAGPGGTYHYHYDGNCMHWHPENEGETHQVSITDNKDFLPEDLTINVGDTVTWTNDDDSSHTVTAEDGQFHSENMEEEATWSYTFTETGTYDYGCNYHGGMEGSVSVVEEDEEIVWTDYTFDQMDDSAHSSIIGFAFDGYPIYGAYGTVDEGIALMRSSYELNDGADGSNGIQDYQYIKDSGHLDACNGVLSATPEFPDGIYHYHSTMPVEVDGEMTTNHAFPYFINCYAGVVESSNFDGGGDGGMPGPPDADNDGVGNGWDMCADTGDTTYPDGYPIYPRGCTEEQFSALSSEEQDAAKVAYAGDNPPAPPDEDGDGIPNPLDDCLNSEIGKLVYFDGCVHETENSNGNISVETNPNPEGEGMAHFTKYSDVFGLGIYAESGITDEQVIHAASIFAELLDNDEDGVVDDEALLSRLQEMEAMMPMFNYEGSPAFDDFVSNYDGHGVSAVLFADEVDPDLPGHWGDDASVEEIMHTINHVGHVNVYPDAFGLEPDSSLLSDAMDVARGGQFVSHPSNYPEEAWYHYDDSTCDYECMAIEYLYWAQVSNMGILNDTQTCDGIANEWKPCSRDLLESMDVLVYALITDPQYHLPQIAPNGNYAPGDSNETEDAPDGDNDGIPDDDDLCPEENASDHDTNADGCIDDMEKETADCKLTMEIMNESFCFSAEDADGNGRPDDFDYFCQNPTSNEKIDNATEYYDWLDSGHGLILKIDDPDNNVETHNDLEKKIQEELRECAIEEAERQNQLAEEELEDAENLSEKFEKLTSGFGVVVTILSCLVIASRRKS